MINNWEKAGIVAQWFSLLALILAAMQIHSGVQAIDEQRKEIELQKK